MQLKVTNLLTYSEKRDPRTGLRTVPGPCTGRWPCKGRPQSVSAEGDVELLTACVLFQEVGPPPPPPKVEETR